MWVLVIRFQVPLLQCRTSVVLLGRAAVPAQRKAVGLGSWQEEGPAAVPGLALCCICSAARAQQQFQLTGEVFSSSIINAARSWGLRVLGQGQRGTAGPDLLLSDRNWPRSCQGRVLFSLLGGDWMEAATTATGAARKGGC